MRETGGVLSLPRPGAVAVKSSPTISGALVGEELAQ